MGHLCRCERAHEQKAAEHGGVTVFALAKPDAHFHEVILAARVTHARRRVRFHCLPRRHAALAAASLGKKHERSRTLVHKRKQSRSAAACMSRQRRAKILGPR